MKRAGDDINRSFGSGNPSRMGDEDASWRPFDTRAYHEFMMLGSTMSLAGGLGAPTLSLLLRTDGEWMS
jgi:hypothetical protein